MIYYGVCDRAYGKPWTVGGQAARWLGQMTVSGCFVRFRFGRPGNRTIRNYINNQKEQPKEQPKGDM
jgi:hypothetical protein